MTPLLPWMRRLLWFAGGFNLCAGFTMLVFYHECYKIMKIPRPDLVMPLQGMGMLVMLFGVAYWLTARDPIRNRNLLLLGAWSKGLGTLLGVYHVARGGLPAVFLVVLFFADAIYLPFFWLILRRIRQAELALGRPG